MGTPDEYRSTVRQLIEIVKQGTFELTQSSCPLEEVLKPIFPSDMLVHKFKCTSCGGRFELGADTYHGNVSWRTVD